MSPRRGERGSTARRINPRRIFLRVLYWIAVLVLAIAILVALVSLLESRDSSQVGKPAGLVQPMAVN